MQNAHDGDAGSDFPCAARGSTMPSMNGFDDELRVADLRLRAAGGPLAVRVRWPEAGDDRGDPPVIVLLPDAGPANGVRPIDDRLAHELCARVGAIVLCAPWAARDDDARRSALSRAEATLDWAADHAAELGADPGRLAVAGRGAGAAAAALLALRAGETGWPRLARQVLVVDEHRQRSETVAASRAALARPRPRHARPAPATLVGPGRGECAARLRSAGIEVEELGAGEGRSAAGLGEDALAELARGLRVALAATAAGGAA